MRDGENIRAVERLGIDMMGFICWPRSPRYVSEVPAYLPQCERVGVFVNQSLDEIQKRMETFGFSYIQLHGSESAEFCQAVREKTGCKVIKAISISSEADLALAGQYEGSVDLLLFDTKCTSFGGSGKQFNWDILSEYRGPLPFLLSGGIGPEDAERLRQFHHDKSLGFDINSRFEIEPGIKDTEKIRTFIKGIQTYEQN
jgi:phosphoribosylanthranilate isomerase